MEVKVGYKKTEIGIIPEEWEVEKIGPFVDLLTGFPFPSNKYSKSGIKLLRGSNIKRGKIDWSEDITQYWENITIEIKKYLLKENDIVIAMDGSLVGKSFAQLTKKDVPSLLLQRVARVRSDKIYIYFLKEFICSIYFTEHCKKVKTSSAIPHISPKDINDFVIPLPPTKEEQTAIATVLSDTDKLIRALEKQIAKKRLIKQGAMQELLKPKEGWVIKKLGEIANIKTGTKNNENKIIDGKYPFFVRSQIVERINTYSYDCEAILIPGEGGIGNIYHYINGKFDVHQRVYVINNFDHSVSGKYIFLYIMKYFGHHAMKNTVKATVDSLRLPTFLKFKIFIPTKHEQTRIATILSDMDAEIEALENKLEKYRKVKQGMMQVLLTGKVRLV